MLIAIPSKGRPQRLTSKEFLPSAIIYCPESEEKYYRQIYNDVVAVPNEIRGITATRNWILKNTTETEVVMVDDDLISCGYIEKEKDGKLKNHKFKDSSVLTKVFEQSFETLYSLGWKIFGIRGESSAWGQHNENPFLFKSYITANCMGIINDGTFYFDENFKVKEDFEIGLRHIAKYGGVLALRYLYWNEKHWTTGGGCYDYRTEQVENDAIRRLIKMYPKYVRKAKKSGTIYDIKLNF